MPTRVALVTALNVERPTCPSCITRRTELSPDDMDVALATIARVLALHRGTGKCGGCATEGPVLSLWSLGGA